MEQVRKLMFKMAGIVCLEDLSIVSRAYQVDKDAEFLWLLGNWPCLFRLKAGLSPELLNGWEDAVVYHIKDGEINPITFAEAKSLLKEPPLKVGECNMQELVDKVEVILNQIELQNFGCPLSNQYKSWKAWGNWFADNDNSFMAEFMKKAVDQHQQLLRKKLLGESYSEVDYHNF